MLPINNRLASSISILANQTMGETFFPKKKKMAGTKETLLEIS